ncbi:MAG: hypothetical protein ACRDOK_21035, partial [Streptosporangiaceae bacterium]
SCDAYQAISAHVFGSQRPRDHRPSRRLVPGTRGTPGSRRYTPMTGNEASVQADAHVQPAALIDDCLFYITLRTRQRATPAETRQALRQDARERSAR